MILPCDKCKGQCCTYPVFTDAEFRIVRFSRGIPEGARIKPIQHVASYDRNVRAGDSAVMIHMDDGNCPYLVDGKCSIYSMRPKVCKDYGTVRDLPCQYLYPDIAAEKHAKRVARSPL